LLTVLALAMSVLPVAYADPATAQVRIGALTPLVTTSPEEGLRQGLAELGYVEGRNLIIERRGAESSEGLRSAAADLVRSKVNLIVAFGTQAAHAALSATATIPVVFLSGDPVATGLAASLAHPGGNASGVSTLSSELMPKRLELLQQVAPHVRRVILLGNPSNPLHPGILKEALKAGEALRIQVVAVDARNAVELDAALRRLRHRASDGVMVSSDLLFLANRAKVAAAVARARLPGMFPGRDYHDAGILMSYGTNLKEAMRRAAAYVDKILKGAKPSELPIEQLSSYEFVVNLRVAREMGINIPQSILLRADEVIR
ncbi:MAG: ABC transporter substrate-binding protein, partial [Terriglobales bacterium]